MKTKQILTTLMVLFSLSIGTIHAVTTTITTTNATLRISGDASKRFGHNMAFLGTLVAGQAPFYAISEPFDSGDNNKGKLYLFQTSQFTGNLTQANAIITLPGTLNEHRYGIFLASGGDIDGDGLNDFIVISPQASTNQIMIYLGKHYNSWAGNLITYSSQFLSRDETTNNNLAASMVSIAGDLNGDGYDDIVIGAPREFGGNNSKGRVYIIFGGTNLTSGELEAQADKILQGTQSYDKIGYSVSIINDTNQDGYDELLIGNYNETLSNGYNAHLFYGHYNQFSNITALSQANAIFFSKGPNSDGTDGFSETVASIGDINDDGYGDFAIGAPHSNSNEGAIYMYLGQETKLSNTQSGTDTYKKINVPGNTLLGLHGIHGGYDYTGDTIHDLIINDPIADETLVESTYILSGKTSPAFSSTINLADDASFRITHTHASDHHFSFSTASGSDINLDGIADIMLGANELGTAYVFELETSIATANPLNFASITTYSDENFTTPSSTFNVGDWVYIQAQTADPNNAQRNLFPLLVTHNNSTIDSLVIQSYETGNATGVYHDKFKLVRSRTNANVSQVKASKTQTLTIQSQFLDTLNTTISIANSAPTLSQVSAIQVGTGPVDTSIEISYFIKDRDNDLITYTPEYRTRVENPWTPLNNWPGADVVENATNIQAYDLGELHTTQNIPIRWSNLGEVTETVYLRLKASDGNDETSFIELPVLNLDNTAPDRPKFDPITSEVISLTKTTPYIVITANAEALSTVTLYTNQNEASVTSSIAGSNGVVTFNNFFISNLENATKSIYLKATDAVGLTSVWSNALSIKLGSKELSFSQPYQATATIPFLVTQNELINLSLNNTSQPAPIPNYSNIACLKLHASNKQTGSFSQQVPIDITFSSTLTTTENIKIYYFNEQTSAWDLNNDIPIKTLNLTKITFDAPYLGTYSVVQHDYPEKPQSSFIKINNEIIKENDYYPASFTIGATITDDYNIASYVLTIIGETTNTIQEINEQNINSTTKDITFNVANLDNDNYTISLVIIDEHNNSTQVTSTIRVNNAIVYFISTLGPNPFNPLIQPLVIGSSISVPVDQYSIIIMDQTGRTLWEYHLNDHPGGYITTEWNGYDSTGNLVPNGIYYAYCFVKVDTSIKKERFVIAVLK